MATTAAQSAQLALSEFDSASTERSIVIPSQAYGNGAATFNLPKAGIPTFIEVIFNGTLSRTEGTTVGTVTANPGWPFNILDISTLTDPAGLTRLSVNGEDLYDLELTKNYGVYPRDPYSQESYADLIYQAAIPSGVASSTTSGTIQFGVVFPVSYTKDSVLGSFVATVPNGTATLTLVESKLTGSTVNFPLTTSGGSTVSLTGTWSPTYYYRDAPSTLPVPVAALSQVHELYHTASNENLSAGQTCQTVLLTGRQYMRLIQRLYANNEADFTNVDRVQFLVNSSTPTYDETLASYLFRMRMRYGRDFPNGMIYRDFTRSPWSPNTYGSLTAQLVLGSTFTAGSYSNLVSLRECLYVPTGNVTAIGAGS